MNKQAQTAPKLDLEGSPAPQTAKVEVTPLSESQLESVLAVKNLSFAWPSSSFQIGMGQGIYVDPARDFCGCYFGLATNDESISGADHSPGYLRAAAKLLAGE